jgi:hypothetical protein
VGFLKAGFIFEEREFWEQKFMVKMAKIGNKICTRPAQPNVTQLSPIS